MAQSIKGAGDGAGGGVLGAEAQKQIQSFADRIKSLIADRATINEDMAEVFNEAAEAGFDRKILRKAVKRAMADPEKARAEEEMVETYLQAIQPDLFTEAKRSAPAAPAETRAAA